MEHLKLLEVQVLNKTEEGSENGGTEPATSVENATDIAPTEIATQVETAAATVVASQAEE